MATRGRKSAAAVAVAAQAGPLTTESRLKPSMHLSDAEMVVWARVVNDQPASAFTETHRDMLAAYCQHVVQAQVLADEIQSFEREWLRTDEGLKRYDRFLAMREREVRAAGAIARSLRITRQATTDPKTVGRANASMARAPRPWEVA